MRFGYLLSEIEILCGKILDGSVDDIPAAMIKIDLMVDEAALIATENSREALDKMVREW